MVTTGILPFRENSHGKTGNRTGDLMISSQTDHEAGPLKLYSSLTSLLILVQRIPGGAFRTSHVLTVLCITMGGA